jgi:hypothetical protein
MANDEGYVYMQVAGDKLEKFTRAGWLYVSTHSLRQRGQDGCLQHVLRRPREVSTVNELRDKILVLEDEAKYVEQLRAAREFYSEKCSGAEAKVVELETKLATLATLHAGRVGAETRLAVTLTREQYEELLANHAPKGG